MKGLYYIFWIVEIVLGFFFLLPALLLILHAIKRLLVGDRSALDRKPVIQKDFSFAAIVTAHKETRFIVPLVDSFLKQTYENAVVYVVADDCDISDLSFNNERVVILKPEPALHAKIKSISHAIDHFVRDHDVIVIFDSDNLMHPRYFEYLNKYFQQGYKAVQTHMLSKNTDTIYSRLDSIGHIYYTFLDRQVRMELGLSSCTLGLGIAIDRNLYMDIMYRDTLGGFDKKMQADIVKAIPLLAFAKEAIVYDEKVDDGQTLETQRTRWLFTYFHYFRINWSVLKMGLQKLNFNLMYFGLVLLRPPLFILVGAAVLCTAINFFISPLYFEIWLGLLGLFALSFILIILTQSRQKGMGVALLYTPLVVMRQLRAILKMKKATRSFMQTEHSKAIYIEDILKNEAGR
jgi:cellulose synthase/poly-beta-1,6-N-acetylglucosamine synthase-like glycosyltransferase